MHLKGDSHGSTASSSCSAPHCLIPSIPESAGLVKRSCSGEYSSPLPYTKAVCQMKGTVGEGRAENI